MPTTTTTTTTTGSAGTTTNTVTRTAPDPTAVAAAAAAAAPSPVVVLKDGFPVNDSQFPKVSSIGCLRARRVPHMDLVVCMPSLRTQTRLPTTWLAT